VRGECHSKNGYAEWQHSVGNGRCNFPVTRRHAIERAMRLHVVQREAFGIEKSFQCTDLVGHEISHFRRCDDHGPAAEALKIGQ
jgi:hypothetical protein